MRHSQMKLFCSTLSAALVFGCGNSNSDSPSDAPAAENKDVTAEFLAKYGTGAEQSYSSGRYNFKMNDDGRIRYSIVDSHVCKLVYEGKIESVKSAEGYLEVKYRYTSLENHRSEVKCNVSDSVCQLDVQDCQRAMDDYDKRSGQAGAKYIKTDSSFEDVVLLP